MWPTGGSHDYRLTDRVPDASTFSQNRRRRFTDTTVYQEIFDAIVEQAIGRGMVEGRVLYTDSKHLKANANKKKFDQVELEQAPSAYLAALDAAVDADRAAHGKKPLRRDEAKAPDSKDVDDDTPDTPGAGSKGKDTKVSRTAPDSGYIVRDEKPTGFFYLDHRTVDARYSIITDTHVTPASVHDSQPYLAQLRRCKTAARASLREDARTAQGGRAIPAGRGGPEHQEDRPAGGTPAGVFMHATTPSRLPAAAHRRTAGPD
jgi:hypothetical protein